MKSSKFILMIMFVVFFGMNMMNAQNLNVETYHLDNGLKVVLCEDHSTATVYGTVFVHAGSKNDPLDATGMAHYFEHIMFKGTDKIGTTNWEKEKVYLDSIDIMYDKLHETDIPEERESIQKKINELSLASTDYAIPNEVDLILKRMGGTNLNAGTSFDYTVYYNSFPSNQIEKWMDVYVERFRNPVFRLFQSELETVYEEKNMYSDNPMSAFSEMMYKECFGEHPYGRPIVGLTEHLKNPQTSKMREFYNTYYVANNMTLILVGDFNTEEVKPMIEEKFSVWRSGELPQQPEYKLPSFDEEVVKEVRMTPIKVGAIVYKGIDNSNEDNIPFTLMMSCLSNGATGIIDEATLNKEFLGAMMLPMSLEDHGSLIFLYIPKIIGQSHKKAEKIVFNAIERIKTGDFSDVLFEAQKAELLKQRMLQLENVHKLSSLFMDLESRDMTYEDYLAETEMIKNLTKDDIVDVANKYFTDNRVILRSKMGFPKAEKVEKPKWKPIEVKNTEAKSDFAKKIESQEVKDIEPQVIEFGKDVVIEKANDAFTMYSTKNPCNNYFNLYINYNYGMIDDPDLEKAVGLLELFGTESKTFEEIELELQKMCASMTLNVNAGYCQLYLSGFEENLEEILTLCQDKLFNAKFDDSKIDLMMENYYASRMLNRNDASTWDNALYNYVIFGDNSYYKNQTPIKKWLKRDSDEIISEVETVFNYSGDIGFIGNTDTQEVIKMLNDYGLIKNDAVKADKKVKKRINYDENVVYFVHNKKFKQSNINFYVPSENLNDKEKLISRVFNKYFGTDMYSIVFQEIREFRSLGYSAYSNFSYDYLDRYPGYLFAFVGTQADKTNEAVEAMSGLIKEMPKKMEKFNVSKEALLMSRNSQYITFRNIPVNVAYWVEEGYDHDPRVDNTNYIKETTYDDIDNFYQTKVHERPMVIMIVGNKKDIDLTDLERYGTVKILKYKDICKKGSWIN